MARHKLALVFLLLCIMFLFLSPWADAPSPSGSTALIPAQEVLAPAQPIVAHEMSHLIVEAALEQEEFIALVSQNDKFMQRHPDIFVELLRIDPQTAYSTYKNSSRLEQSADIMLLSNEWVKEFASSGYLLPTDAAYIGKALAEQYEALVAPLKWNGYLWGVPRDMDPFVLVWNSDLLEEWLTGPISLPLTLEQWTLLAEKSMLSPEPVSWLTLDRTDPLTLMAWFDNAVSERSDKLWDEENASWQGAGYEQAVTLLEQHRANLTFAETEEEVFRLLRERATLAAIVPYSVAAQWDVESRLDSGPKLTIDHHSWKLPFVWPRGSSFAISSTTEAEEAAYVWISEMTDDQMQLENLEQRHMLPVYRSLYESDRELTSLLPGRNGQTFPNQAPLQTGPDVAERLTHLGSLWERLASGSMTLEEWKQQWITRQW